MQINDLRKKTGVSIELCKMALDYAKGDEKIAIAYIKAETLAISTPNLTFEERISFFIRKNQ